MKRKLILFCYFSFWKYYFVSYNNSKQFFKDLILHH